MGQPLAGGQANNRTHIGTRGDVVLLQCAFFWRERAGGFCCFGSVPVISYPMLLVNDAPRTPSPVWFGILGMVQGRFWRERQRLILVVAGFCSLHKRNASSHRLATEGEEQQMMLWFIFKT